MPRRIIYLPICLLVLLSAGCIVVEPVTLDFGIDKTTETFMITVQGNASIPWNIESDKSWVTIEPESGTTTTHEIFVTVDRTGLKYGNYEATLCVMINKNCCSAVIIKMEVSASQWHRCEVGGGTVTSALCCESVGDFPNLCLVGACGCSPEYSHEVFICQCPEGFCWDSVEGSCMPSYPPL